MDLAPELGYSSAIFESGCLALTNHLYWASVPSPGADLHQGLLAL
jgi:hypothetical protein